MIDVDDQRWMACTVTHGFNETRARVAPGASAVAWRFYLPAVQAAHIPALTDAERKTVCEEQGVGLLGRKRKKASK